VVLNSPTTIVLESTCAFKSFSVCLIKLSALTLGRVGTVFSLPLLLEQAFSLAPGLTGGDWRFRKDIRQTHRQKVGSGVLGARVETPNPHCFFSVSLFFKALLLVVL
jgi:hypothetical protein